MLAHGFTVDFLVDHPHWDGDYTDRARGRRGTRDGSRTREDHGGGAAGTRGASMALIYEAVGSKNWFEVEFPAPALRRENSLFFEKNGVHPSR